MIQSVHSRAAAEGTEEPATPEGPDTSRSLPRSLRIADDTFVLKRAFKDGFWSAVGLYGSSNDQVVLKRYRSRGFRGFPLRWLGRFMARREMALLHAVEGIEGVPRLVGPHGPTGLVHEHLEGHPLRFGEPVPADFFDRLDALLAALHERGIAYADLSKRDNVLRGDDGHPYLFDFQIAWSWPPHPGASPAARLLPGFVGRAVLRSLQDADRHHALKHRNRLAPESLAKDDRGRLKRPVRHIRVFRFLTTPYRSMRRRARHSRDEKP